MGSTARHVNGKIFVGIRLGDLFKKTRTTPNLCCDLAQVGFFLCGEAINYLKWNTETDIVPQKSQTQTYYLENGLNGISF